MYGIVDMTDPAHSNNPVVRIVAYQTSPKQPDAISLRRIKLHATHGPLDGDRVEKLVDDAVSDGELVEVEERVYAVTE